MSVAMGAAIDRLPLPGLAYKSTTGAADILMRVSWQTMTASVGGLVIVGLLTGPMPAVRARRLGPVEAQRYE